MIRIALADDHRIVREGLAALLGSESDIKVISQSSRANEFYDQAKVDRPDLALLDINMPGIDGFDLAQTLREEFPDLPIVFLTSRKDAPTARRAFELGANGYVLKDDAFDDLIDAVRTVMDGKSFISTALEESLQADDPLSLLAPREREVLVAIARGLINKEVAEELGVSINTVRTHRARIMEKLHLHTGPELTRFAIDRGLLD